MSYLIEFDQVDPALGERNQSMLPVTWSFDSLAGVLQTIPGISRVEVTGGRGERTMGISYKFESITSLNHALSRMLLADTTEVFRYFARENGLWVRKHKADRMSLSEGFVSKSKDEREVALMLSRLEYEVSMSFKKPIGVVYSGAPASLEGRKNNHLRMSASLAEISQSPEALSATILLD